MSKNKKCPDCGKGNALLTVHSDLGKTRFAIANRILIYKCRYCNNRFERIEISRLNFKIIMRILSFINKEFGKQDFEFEAVEQSCNTDSQKCPACGSEKKPVWACSNIDCHRSV